MKVLYWNVRGLGNLETRLMVKKLCLMHKPDFLFLSEPWISTDQVPFNFWNGLKLKLFATNDRGHLRPNIWCLCADQFQPTVIANSSQYISI